MEWTGLLLLVCLLAGARRWRSRRRSTAARSAASWPTASRARRAAAAGTGTSRSRAPTARPMPRSCATTRRGSSTSRASASCRSTTRVAAAAPAPTRPTTATSTPTAAAPGQPATVFTRAAAPRRQDLHPVLALLPGLEHRLGRLGRDLGAQQAAAADREGGARRPATTRASTRTTGRATSSGSTRTARVWARASSHGHYQGCKERFCHNRWMRASGWTRVSRGSHAGHLPRGRCRGWTCASAPPRRRACG